MTTILRNIFAVILGLFVGGTVNMALIVASPHVIPPPSGVDVSNTESLRASILLFEPKHFVFPFLAHALGTLAGALVAYLIAGKLSVRLCLCDRIPLFCGRHRGLFHDPRADVVCRPRSCGRLLTHGMDRGATWASSYEWGGGIENVIWIGRKRLGNCEVTQCWGRECVKLLFTNFLILMLSTTETMTD